MIPITVKAEGLGVTSAYLRGLGRQVPFATAKALTKTAHAVNADIKDEMQRTIQGGPTAYTLRAFKVTGARKDKLEAVIELRKDFPSKGNIWARSLGHLFVGGSRDSKKMERAFMGAGILPSGYMMVPASNSWAMPLDAYGNAPRGLIVQLLSYFNTSGEQGYKANMTDKRRAKLANRGLTAKGYRTINGVVYFISYGRRGRPGGDRFTNGRHDQHLPAGIWAKRGTHGADVAPVFLFVRMTNYGRRFDLEAIATKTVDRVWQSNMDAAIADAMRTAK